MIQLQSSLHDTPQNAVLDLAALEIQIIDDRYKKGYVDYQNTYFDLRQLAAIQVFNAAQNSARKIDTSIKRFHLNAQAEDKAQLIDNHIISVESMGALAIGECDYDVKLKAHYPQVRFAVGVKNIALLLFKNGDSISYAIDARQFAELFQVLYKVGNLQNVESAVSPIFYRPLSVEQLEFSISVHEKAARKELSQKLEGIKSIGTAVIIVNILFTTGVLICFVTNQLFDSPGLPRVNPIVFIVCVIGWIGVLILDRVEQSMILKAKTQSGLL